MITLTAEQIQMFRKPAPGILLYSIIQSEHIKAIAYEPRRLEGLCGGRGNRVNQSRRGQAQPDAAGSDAPRPKSRGRDRGAVTGSIIQAAELDRGRSSGAGARPQSPVRDRGALVASGFQARPQRRILPRDSPWLCRCCPRATARWTDAEFSECQLTDR